MGAAVGEVLTFAVGVALSPIAVIASVVILSTPKGKANGLVFLVGWVLGLAVAGTALLLFAGGMDLGAGDDPSTRSSYIRLAFGILLVAVAVRRFRARASAGAKADEPGWLKSLDEFNAAKILGLSVLCALNPKNLVLLAGATMSISQTDADTAGQATALAVFVIVGSVGAAAPIAIDLFMGDRSSSILSRLRGWMTRESTTIIGIICLVIAAKLIGEAISGLS